MQLGQAVEPAASRFVMPDPALATPGDDLIAIGADLAPGTLLAAYRAGIFPMPVEPRRKRSKMAWYSPDPRGIIPIDGLHVTRSMRKSARRFEIRHDTAFTEVMRRCGDPTRPGRWITEEIVTAYDALYGLGWAHSIEVWRDDRLVGGVYGLLIDRLFAGESMFHLETDASKVALDGAGRMAAAARRRAVRRAMDDTASGLTGGHRRTTPEVPATARRCGRSTGNVTAAKAAPDRNRSEWPPDHSVRSRDGRPTIPWDSPPWMAARPSNADPGWAVRPPPTLSPSPAESAKRPTWFPPEGNLSEPATAPSRGRWSWCRSYLSLLGRTFFGAFDPGLEHNLKIF